ncbi:MAG: ABC transporter substrate-binding protein [Minisyncoccia bacterium]
MNKANKIILTGVIIVLVMLVGALYLKNKNSNNTIKIGATIALTGNYASIGEQEANGMELAVEEINKAGGVNGKQLSLIVEDNQGDPKSAVAGVTKLLDDDGVNFIRSAFTGITNAIKSIVAQHNKVMIYTSTLSDIAKSNPLFFMDYYKADDAGTAIADAVNKSGYRTVKYLTEVSDPCNKYGAAFQAEADKLGIHIVDKETYLTTETDLKTPLLKIKSGAKFDALVLCSWEHEQIIMPEMQQLGMLNIPTFHLTAPFLSAAQTPEMTQLFSQNKSISTWYGFSDPASASPKQTEFINDYYAKFSIKPTPDAAYSYDDIYLLADAAQNCPSLDSNCIASGLAKATYNGAGGQISFDSDRVAERNTLVIQAVNGSWRTIGQ